MIKMALCWTNCFIISTDSQDLSCFSYHAITSIKTAGTYVQDDYLNTQLSLLQVFKETDRDFKCCFATCFASYSVLLKLQWPSEQWKRRDSLPTRPEQSAGSHVRTAQRICVATSVRQDRSYQHSLMVRNIKYTFATKVIMCTCTVCLCLCMYI